MKRVFSGHKKLVLLAAAAALLLGGGAARAIFLGGAGDVNGCKETSLSSGLVGWWKFDGNANDSSGNAHNGSVSGATLTTDQKNIANCAYSFNGTSNNITAGDLSYTKSLPFSVSAWFYSTGGGADAGIVNKYSQGSWNGFNLFLQSDRVCSWYLTQGAVFDHYTAVAASNGVGSVTCPRFTANAWNNVIVTVDSSGMSMYLNGSLAATSGWTGTSRNSTETTQLTFGAYDSNAAGYFGGSIDDIRIYNRVLSAANVNYLFGQYYPSLAVASGESGLVGWWKMDGNSKDSSPYRDNGTVHAATLTTDRKAATNSAYSFNGSTGTYIDLGNSATVQQTTGTLSAWIKTSTTTANYFAIVTKQFAYGLFDYGGNLVTYDWNTSTRRDSGFSIADNQWHHVSMSYQSGVTNGTILYVDGIARLTTTVTIQNISSQNLVIGAGIGDGSLQNFNGSIDDVRFYNRLLSASEVTTQYKSYNSQLSLQNLGAGVVGEWTFNGNAKDFTPYRNNGTITSASLTTDREGRANSAYSFNGSSSTINLGNPTQLGFERTDSFSISAWVKTSSTAQQAIFSKMADSAPFTGYEFAVTNSNDEPVLLLINTWTGNTISVNSNTGISLNAWHHLVVTYTGSSNASGITFYIDGSAVSSVTTTFNSLSASILNSISVYIGSRNNTTEYFTGSIDDLRVWKRALSAAEVAQIFKVYR